MVKISINYGFGTDDIPIYTIVDCKDDQMEVAHIGQLRDFDYGKFITTPHQVIGEREDIRMFKKQFLKGEE